MKETYLGVDVSPLTYEGIIASLEQRMERNEQSTIIAVNPEKVMTAQTNDTLKRLINTSTFQIADGIGIILASKLKKGAITERVTGVDMMARLLEFARDNDYPIYMYGAKRQVLDKAKANIERTYPGITIAGSTDGYEQDEEKIVSQIEASGAKLLFVALGSPKQELWIERHMNRLSNVLVFQGVGGSFDVFSGTVKRAPALFRKTGTEWLYRLITNPSRWKRQLNLPRFLIRIIFQK